MFALMCIRTHVTTMVCVSNSFETHIAQGARPEQLIHAGSDYRSVADFGQLLGRLVVRVHGKAVLERLATAAQSHIHQHSPHLQLHLPTLEDQQLAQLRPGASFQAGLILAGTQPACMPTMLLEAA